MNWHTGNIAEAVAESKAKDAIFVVYIEGQDEMTAKLNRFLDDARVIRKLQTSDFVAVKIQGESATYAQFMSLYKVVPVPSIFFIANSGTPLDIATGIIASVEELVAKIDKVLLHAGKRRAPVTDLPTTTAMAGSSRSIAGADDDDEENEQNKGSSGNPPPEGNPPAAPTGANQRQQTAASEPFAAPPTAVPTPAPPGPPTVGTLPETVSPGAASPPAAAASPPPATGSPPAAVVSPHAAVVAPPAAVPTPPAAVVPSPAAVVPSPAAVVPSPAAVASAPAGVSSPTEAPPSLEPSAAAAAAADKRKAAAAALNAAGSTTSSALPRGNSIVGTARPIVEIERTPLSDEQRREGDSILRQRREAEVQEATTRGQELQIIQDRIRRERQQVQETRERILAQIAADRAEQASRLANQQSIHQADITTNASTESSINAVDETRLQIRLPGGIIRTHAFPIAEPLSSVRAFVINELITGTNIREFTLATNYPRREFKLEDEAKTLIDLNLVPNAILLVIQRDTFNPVVRTGGSVLTMLTSVFWAMLTPATMAIEYAHKMGWQRLRHRFIQFAANLGLVKPPNQFEVRGFQNDNDGFYMRGFRAHPPTEAPGFAAETTNQQPPPPAEISTSAPQREPRYGEPKIRRLADSISPEDDDQATYNGNSTQQQ